MTTVNPQSPVGASGYQPSEGGGPVQMTPEQAVNSNRFNAAMQSGTENAKKGATRYAHLNASNIVSGGESLNAGNILGYQSQPLNAGNILGTLGPDPEDESDESES